MSAGRPAPGDGARDNVTGASAPASVRPRVLLWFDYACPFCYVDWFRFERLAREHDVEIVLVPYELRPSAPPEGISAKEQGLAHSEHVAAYIAKVAAEEGIVLHDGDLLPNTHLALIAGEVARDEGPQTHRRMHVALFAALYGDDLDIGSRDVLLSVADGAGLDRAKVTAAWSDERYEQRLHAFRHLAMAMGVDATPAALICNELLIGTRPAAVIAAAIERCIVSHESAGGRSVLGDAAAVAGAAADGMVREPGLSSRGEGWIGPA